MARRGRQDDGSVRGPTSALTNFLASLGVEAQPSNSRDNDNASPSGSGSGLQSPAAGASSVPTPIAEEQEAPELDSEEPDEYRPVKRRRAASVDSDDLDGDDEYTPGTSAPPSGAASSAGGPSVRRGPLKGVGEFMNCGECGKQFTVTAYTKEHPNRTRTWLCVGCCPKLGINAFAKPRKPRAGAASKATPAKAERGKIQHYEVAKGATPLADMCIEIIGKYIEEVEALGDIGSINLDKVCKIISKSRRLTPATATLFYSVNRTELDLYDCTNLVHESYLALANLNPNLEKLNLQMCGQLTTDTLIAWGKSMNHLKSIELNGPFLARKEGWLSFFESRGETLEEFSVIQSPRIDLEVVETMVRSCPNLRKLQLREIGQFDSDWLAVFADLKHLESLTISSPGHAISTDAVIQLLEAIGAGLTSLDLSDNPELDDTLLTAIASFCPQLNTLSLRGIPLSEGSLEKYFQTLIKSGRRGFIALDLEKGHDLAGGDLSALTKHSCDTLERLSLVGWRHVDKDAVAGLADCKQLRYLDLGWCRNVDDFTVKDIIDGCVHISELRVWGCNQLSDRVPRKRGLKVIGIETHAL